MVRAAGSYPAGRWFESDRRYQSNTQRHTRPHGQAVKTSPFHGGNGSSILPGVTNHGGIAQLGERLPYKQDVTSSSLVVPTKRSIRAHWVSFFRILARLRMSIYAPVALTLKSPPLHPFSFVWLILFGALGVLFRILARLRMSIYAPVALFGCARLRSPPLPPCERIFCPISVGSVAQCNNAIHAPTLGTRTKSLFLGRKIPRYGTLPFRKFPIWILTGRKSQGVAVQGSVVVGQAEQIPLSPPQ